MIKNSLYLIINASLAHPTKQKTLDLYLETVNIGTTVKALFSHY